MPIQFDKFDQEKVDNLKKHLESCAAKGQAKTYEIHVDGVKSVMKTDDPAEFENYESYMREDSNELKVIIYSSNSSPRNDKYVFSLKAKSQKEALDMGLDGFASKAYSENDIKEMAAKRQKVLEDAQELEMLRMKVTEQEKKLKESSELVETMQKIIDKAKENGNKIGGFHLGDVLSVAAEGFVKRNAPAIEKATGIEGLAGFFAGEGNSSQEQTQESGVASFKKKQSSESSLTAHEKEFIALFHELEKCFSQEEMLQIIDILQSLREDKSQLTPILELLRETGE